MPKRGEDQLGRESFLSLASSPPTILQSPAEFEQTVEIQAANARC